MFDQMLVNVVGDILISAGSVAYLGPFTVSQIGTFCICGECCLLPVLRIRTYVGV